MMIKSQLQTIADKYQVTVFEMPKTPPPAPKEKPMQYTVKTIGPAGVQIKEYHPPSKSKVLDTSKLELDDESDFMESSFVDVEGQQEKTKEYMQVF